VTPWGPILEVPVPVLPGAEPFVADGGPVGVVLCHGFTGTVQSLRPWAEHLAAAGLTVHAPLLPGHGTRWQDLNDTRWPEWYGELERAFLTVRRRCDEVFVMGLSMGGTLALRLAETSPDAVAGLVVVNASLTTTRRDARLLPLASRVLPSISGIGSDIARPDVRELAYPRTPLRALASMRDLWRVTRADLARVQAPLLAFRSRVDHVVEPVSTSLLLAGVSSTDVQERVLERSYHVATLDHDAPEIFAASLQFVRSRSGARSGGGGR